MIWNIVIWGCVIWLIPLIYFMFSNETKFKKNIVVGVTFPEEAKSNDRVLDRLKQFKHEIAILSVLLFLVAVPCVWITDIWLMMTVWGIWIDCVILLYYVPYVRCNHELKRIKRKYGWGSPVKNTITVDMETIQHVKTISLFRFLLPAMISMVPILWNRDLWMIYIVFGFTIVVYGLFYRYFYRNRSEMVNEEKDLTLVLTQIRKYNWSKIWLFASWWTVALSFVMSLGMDHPMIAFALVFILILLIYIVSIYLEVKTRHLQEKLTKKIGKEYVDEDVHWIGGILYYNPNDSHLIVNNRIGLNTTINLARTSGKILMGVIAGLLILMPFYFQGMRLYYQDPIHIEVKSTEVVARQGITTYEIPFEGISDVKVIDDLPDHLMRVNGTSVDRLLKGQFTSHQTKMTLLLNPESKAFIKIVDQDGTIYLLGDDDTEDVGKLAKKIQKYVNDN